MRREKIGLLGLGRMGSALSERLSQEGFSVSGWSRSGIGREKAAALRLTEMADMRDLVAASDIIILSLLDDAAVHDVLAEICACDIAGKLVVDTSTVSPKTLRHFSPALSSAGACALDAPIAGGPDMVLAGQVGLYIGGAEKDFQRFLPIAETLSNRVLHVGGLGDGATAKLVNNMMLLGYWQCLKEALQLGKRQGLDLATMISVLSGSPAASNAFRSRIPVILGETDVVGFSAAGALKDALVVRDVAEASNLPIPAMSAGLASFEEVLAKGFGEADLAIMVRLAAEEF